MVDCGKYEIKLLSPWEREEHVIYCLLEHGGVVGVEIMKGDCTI